MWRTLWQRFELPLISQKGKGYRFSLEELNEMVYEYALEDMKRPAPMRNESKRVVFERDMLARPQRTFDVDLDHIAYWPYRRKVRADLTFSLDGELYNAPERYYGKYVVIKKNRYGDLVGEGEDDKIRFEITPFSAQVYGDYKRYGDTYRERMLKAVDDRTIKMQPRKEKIKVNSDFTAPAEPVEMTLEQAKTYITRQLNLDTYRDVATLFDPLLAERLDKPGIDEVIKIVKKQAV
jgi:hypothetical protein